MMHPSGSIYELRDEYDRQTVEERLSGYHTEVYSEKLEDDLEASTEVVEPTERGLRFVVEFDYIEEIDLGADDEMPVKGRKQVVGFFCKDIASDGFILIGPDRSTASNYVSEAIERDPDSSEPLEISSRTITEVVRNDSRASRFKMWNNIDTFTDMAMVQGALDDSTYSQDLDNDGFPIWVMFDSRSTGRVVGLSRSSIVLYGDVNDVSEVESYYFNTVEPNL